jgi:hypothetical protein
MNDGFRNALKEIAAQDTYEIALDPGWPRRIAEAALAALPADILPNNMEKARAELVAVIRRGSVQTAEELAIGLERFIDAKISAAALRM